MDLAAELARHGPEAPLQSCSLDEARGYCRRLARSHYENFSVVSWLFPKRLTPHLEAVYAYCRWADDLADETGDPAESLRLLDWWEGELNKLPAQATHPVFVALRETLREFSLPLTPFCDLLSAFRQDQSQTRYEHPDDLLAYCQRSANPVGRIVLALGNSVTPENLLLSDSICTGLQLANFCQDVARDAQKGRIYLPRSGRVPVGWDDNRFFAEPLRADEAFRKLLRGETERAEYYLRAGEPLVRQVSREIRWPVRTFLGGGLAIVAAIRRQKFDVLARRPKVSGFQKLTILAASWLRSTFLW